MFFMTIMDDPTRNKMEALYSLYYKALFFTAFDILKDYHEAEDVLQSALLKIFGNLDKIDDINCNKTKGFIVIMVRNMAINIYNKRKRRAEIHIDGLEDILIDESGMEPEQCILRLDHGKWVARQLSKLNPEYADILALKYTYGYSNDEIAHLLDTVEGNVRVKLHRARKALLTIMKGDEYEKTTE